MFRTAQARGPIKRPEPRTGCKTLKVCSAVSIRPEVVLVEPYQPSITNAWGIFLVDEVIRWLHVPLAFFLESCATVEPSSCMIWSSGQPLALRMFTASDWVKPVEVRKMTVPNPWL